MTQEKDNKAKGSRRVGRTLAFQVLYGLSFVPALPEESIDSIMVKSPAVFDPDEEGLTGTSDARKFGIELLEGIHTNQNEIDEVITKYSKHWKLDRIARVELAILRLSLYELMYRSDIPLRVSINEAVELSKAFADDKSRPFINGILDAAAKAIDGGKLAAKPKL